MSCVRVLPSSIRMPTSTVKQVSGPLPTQKIYRNRVVVVRRLAQFFRNSSTRFAPRITLITFWLLLSLTSISNASAQTLNVRINLISVSSPRLRIEAALPSATNVLSFRNTYANVMGLGERIEALTAFNDRGERVPVQKLAPGEFESSGTFSRVTYEVNLIEPARPAEMAHVTWLHRDQGLLMLSDLIPQETVASDRVPAAVISVDVPPGWGVASNIKREGSYFLSHDLETAVFLVGTSVQEKHQRLGSTDFAIISAGEWPFSNKDALQIAEKIMEEHLRVTRFPLKHNAVLMLVPYPGEAGPENWSAETRGNDVVLVLGRSASRRKVLAKLGMVLSHELFHLWVPNSLSLKGDYDWFFEGFTLYQALRTDLRLGLISFDDYLATIAKVYDSYRASVDADRMSLMEASERRWTTSTSLVYEKGMLVAFIYDLLLRRTTDCGASLESVYADLFRLPETGQGSANETIIRILSERNELRSFARDYIESAGKLSLEGTLAGYGMELQRQDAGGTKLVLVSDLNKTQRRLLGCIGYKK
jgi:predicted metalloprotease with PDZ domain